MQDGNWISPDELQLGPGTLLLSKQSSWRKATLALIMFVETDKIWPKVTSELKQ